MAGLRLERIGKDFGSFTAVRDVTLDFPDGELTALLGPSGCGKTTLLRLIAGLEAPSRGRVLLGDRDLTDQAAHERRFGMVFQSFALFPHLNVVENVAYALTIAGVARKSREARARELLDLVQLADFGDRRVGALSGGQRQRVAIARALAQEPQVFLLDEPMSALDAKLREEMQVELRLLQQRLGITTIVVTHDQREALTMADRIVVMSGGEAEQVGPPQEVYHHPATPFVAGFIGKANMLTGTVRRGRIEVPGGVLTVPEPPRFIDGTRVTLACRPEWLRLARDGEGANRLPARITFVRDIGQVREIHLTLGGQTVLCELPFADRTPWRVGEDVYVEFPPEGLRLFPADGVTGAAA